MALQSVVPGGCQHPSLTALGGVTDCCNPLGLICTTLGTPLLQRPGLSRCGAGVGVTTLGGVTDCCKGGGVSTPTLTTLQTQSGKPN